MPPASRRTGWLELEIRTLKWPLDQVRADARPARDADAWGAVSSSPSPGGWWDRRSYCPLGSTGGWREGQLWAAGAPDSGRRRRHRGVDGRPMPSCCCLRRMPSAPRRVPFIKHGLSGMGAGWERGHGSRSALGPRLAGEGGGWAWVAAVASRGRAGRAVASGVHCEGTRLPLVSCGGNARYGAQVLEGWIRCRGRQARQ